MTGNHRYDSIQMFRHACAFADCAEIIGHTPQSVVDRTKWYIAPKVANMAFACEIYLKTLLFYNKISYIKEHKMENLYALLPETYKEIIEQETLQRYGKTKDAFGFDYIDGVSDAFQKWRYSFEFTHLRIEVDYIRMLCELLRDVCCRDLFQMSWDKYRKMEDEQEAEVR